MLRYDSPVQSFVRTCLSAANVGGTEVAPGELVFVIIAAANRDPGAFANPDTFDIARSPNHHLSFGEGIHFCIGAPLARLVSSIAIGSILERYSRLRLADPDAPLVYHGSYILRGLKTLPMAVTPARRPWSTAPKTRRPIRSGVVPIRYYPWSAPRVWSTRLS